MTLPKAIICDIDMTLADCSHRLHFVEKPPRCSSPFRDCVCEKCEKSYSWEPNWDAFYEEMDKDSLISVIGDLIVKYDNESILFVTERPERYYKKTLKWILKNLLFCEQDRLFMRPDYLHSTEWVQKEGGTEESKLAVVRKPDHRPSHIVKREIYEKEIRAKFDVLFVLEDSPECCEMYKISGLTVLRIM